MTRITSNMNYSEMPGNSVNPLRDSLREIEAYQKWLDDEFSCITKENEKCKYFADNYAKTFAKITKKACKVFTRSERVLFLEELRAYDAEISRRKPSRYLAENTKIYENAFYELNFVYHGLKA